MLNKFEYIVAGKSNDKGTVNIEDGRNNAGKQLYVLAGFFSDKYLGSTHAVVRTEFAGYIRGRGKASCSTCFQLAD